MSRPYRCTQASSRACPSGTGIRHLGGRARRLGRTLPRGRTVPGAPFDRQRGEPGRPLRRWAGSRLPPPAAIILPGPRVPRARPPRRPRPSSARKAEPSLAQGGIVIGIADVRDAAARIEGHVRRTPVVDASQAKDPVAPGAILSLKLELLQVTGSFKG